MEHTEMRTLDYLKLLATLYPNRAAVSGEIINLSAILNLPKGTEHFMSDLHGEHEAFLHIRRNASGVIRKKIDQLFGRTLTAAQRAELATLIYYPEEKLDTLRETVSDLDDWYAVASGVRRVARSQRKQKPPGTTRRTLSLYARSIPFSAL